MRTPDSVSPGRNALSNGWIACLVLAAVVVLVGLGIQAFLESTPVKNTVNPSVPPRDSMPSPLSGEPLTPQSAVPDVPDGSSPYGDYTFRETLPEVLDHQYRSLVEDARAQPTNEAERSRLSITEEEARRLRESGALVF